MPSSSNRPSSRKGRKVSTSDKDLIVEKIVEQRLQNGKLQYLVKWEGIEQTTWEDADIWTPVSPGLGFQVRGFAITDEHPTSEARNMSTYTVRNPESDLENKPRPKLATTAKPVKSKSHKRKRRSINLPSKPKQSISSPPGPFYTIDGELHYEVEEVLQSRIQDGNLEYKIKWLGYEDEADITWEPASGVRALEAVEDFHRAHPDAPR